MARYFIEKDADDRLTLRDEAGEVVEVTKLLEEAGKRRVIAFDAPMGTGKTTLIKALCEAMGTEDVVNSPTFAIVNVYDVKGASGKSEEVYHFDCYRLKDIREALDFGAMEYLESGCWCLIEWPDIIEPLLPEETMWVKMRVLEDSRREVTINAR